MRRQSACTQQLLNVKTSETHDGELSNFVKLKCVSEFPSIAFDDGGL